jgi:hypothetical protein
MPPLPNILADHDGSIAKLIIFAVIAVIWAIQALIAVARNASRKRQQQQAIRRTQPPAPPPLPPQVRAQVRPLVAPRPKPVVAARTNPAVATRAKMPMPPRPAQPRAATQPMRLPPLSSLAAKGRPVRTPVAAPAQAATPALAPSAVAAPLRRPEPPAPAPTRVGIARWVDRQSVRSQFLLSEALQPPLALRTRSHLP